MGVAKRILRAPLVRSHGRGFGGSERVLRVFWNGSIFWNSLVVSDIFMFNNLYLKIAPR